MTQKEIEKQITEINNMYADRRKDLNNHFTSEIAKREIEMKELRAKHDETSIELQRKYSELLTKDNELLRQGFTYYSIERDAVQGKMREIKLQIKENRAKFRSTDLALATAIRNLKAELQSNLANNAHMRENAKKELWAKLEKIDN